MKAYFNVVSEQESMPRISVGDCKSVLHSKSSDESLVMSLTSYNLCLHAPMLNCICKMMFHFCVLRIKQSRDIYKKVQIQLIMAGRCRQKHSEGFRFIIEDYITKKPTFTSLCVAVPDT